MVVKSLLIIAAAVVACLSYLYVKAKHLFVLQQQLDQQIRQNQTNFNRLVVEQLRLEQELEDLRIRQALINDMKQRVRDEKRYVREQRELMEDILANNQVILKRNEMHLYNIKESSITTLNDYKRMSRLLGKILAGDDGDNVDKLHELWIGAQLKVASIESNFEDIFKQTPGQYLDSKGRVNDTDYTLN